MGSKKCDLLVPIYGYITSHGQHNIKYILISLFATDAITWRHTYIYIYMYVCVCVFGPGSSVGIETDYGLDGPGSNPGGDEIFRPSRPALGPTQPRVQWVQGLSRE